eukprot:5137203-Prymnesium_polylepis.1
MIPSLWVACPALCARYRSYELRVTLWAKPTVRPRPATNAHGKHRKFMQKCVCRDEFIFV